MGRDRSLAVVTPDGFLEPPRAEPKSTQNNEGGIHETERDLIGPTITQNRDIVTTSRNANNFHNSITQVHPQTSVTSPRSELV